MINLIRVWHAVGAGMGVTALPVWFQLFAAPDPYMARLLACWLAVAFVFLSYRGGRV